MSELHNRDSAIVRDALKRRCEVCKANPGQECANTRSGPYELPGRLVHYARTDVS